MEVPLRRGGQCSPAAPVFLIMLKRTSSFNSLSLNTRSLSSLSSQFPTEGWTYKNIVVLFIICALLLTIRSLMSSLPYHSFLRTLLQFFPLCSNCVLMKVLSNCWKQHCCRQPEDDAVFLFFIFSFKFVNGSLIHRQQKCSVSRWKKHKL